MKNDNIDYLSPIYIQLRELLRTKIEDGEFPPGGVIPSDTALAEQYGVNRLTARNAIDALVKEGLLKRVRGRGVYVLYGKIEQDLGLLTGFTSTMNINCRQPSIRILEFKTRTAGRKYAKIFQINPEDEMYYIRRLCSADDEPTSLEEIYIPSSAAKRLEGINLSVFSLREAFNFVGIRLERAYETLEIVEIDAQEARLLDTESQRNVFLVRYSSQDDNGNTVEYGKCYIRGDKFSFSVNYLNDAK